jgi:hypothetical protein
MTEQEIIEIAKQYADPVTDHFDLIAFARLIAKRQREIDAGICKSLELDGRADNRFAAAILAQGD